MSFVAIPSNAYFTIAQINALFSALAIEINGLLDALPGDIVITHDDSVVKVGANDVVIDNDATLSGDVGFNGKPIINLAPGELPTDAATVRQAKDWLGIS